MILVLTEKAVVEFVGKALVYRLSTAAFLLIIYKQDPVSGFHLLYQFQPVEGART